MLSEDGDWNETMFTFPVNVCTLEWQKNIEFSMWTQITQ